MSIQLPTDEVIQSSILPTCNRNASNVKDVYNVYDIIPKSKLETLYEHAKEVLEGAMEGYLYFFLYKHTLILYDVALNKPLYSSKEMISCVNTIVKNNVCNYVVILALHSF